MRRAILIVMDGCGVGVAPDATEFGDFDAPSTLLHVWRANRELRLPHLESLGLLAAADILPPKGLRGRAGRLVPASKGGKDSVTGHWEMAGIVLETRFPTYPDGFPPEVIRAFKAVTNRDILGNKPASGTAILEELGAEHLRTGAPIVYTSADSVFQIAAHTDRVPIDQLYRWCEAARGILVPPHGVQRVIARPFSGAPGAFIRTNQRRDYPMAPPPNLVDEIRDVHGIGVVPELFGGRGFRSVPRTQSNAEHAEALRDALADDARFIWANFEDFDMRYGHRNDPIGFGRCLEEFDSELATILPLLTAEDLLIITADHGNDPTDESTDHTRECVPFLQYRPHEPGVDLVTTEYGFNRVAEAVRTHLELATSA